MKAIPALQKSIEEGAHRVACKRRRLGEWLRWQGMLKGERVELDGREVGEEEGD